jgi:hypothetical protein
VVLWYCGIPAKVLQIYLQHGHSTIANEFARPKSVLKIYLQLEHPFKQILKVKGKKKKQGFGVILLSGGNVVMW